MNDEVGTGENTAVPSSSPPVIATLPPIPMVAERLDLSERTGVPRRPGIVVAAVLLGYLAGVPTAITYAISWWRAAHQNTFSTSARLIEWVSPQPGSLAALSLVALLAALAALMVAAPAIISYNAWNGHRWTRIGGLISLASVAGGALLFSEWGWIAVALTAVASGLLWAPQATRYFSLWDAFRAPQQPADRRDAPIVYGPLPRYR